LERDAKKKAKARDDLPLGTIEGMKSVDPGPSPFQIMEDPINIKKNLPTSAIAMVNAAKKAQKGQKVVETPKTKVGGKGGKGKGGRGRY
jgi:hypothetical protein